MRKIYCIIVLFVSFKASAQQDAQFSHYIFNQLFVNPATAGSENVTRFQAIYRTQYLGYQSTFDDGGAPVSQVISANIPLKMIKSGIGFTFVNDKIGASTQRDLKLSYAYHLPVGGSQLALGVSGGFFTRGIDYGRLRARDENDPLIATGNVSQSAFDLGAGAYLYNPGYSIGLSMNHLNEPTFGLGTKTATNTLKRSAYLTGSMLFGVSYMIDVSPMLIIKSDLSTISAEVGAMATYDNKYWFGASYRTGDAVSTLLGANLMNGSLRVGYAMDIVVGGANAKSATSHEILLSYALAALRAGKKSIVRTPRYRY
ncbi:type IX secretion system membrane protein PorP/SprF [Emticicia sp.]|uniref:PorP/SprF family type IX secretion system membrane protein n=1 Tax=Emticicia sp. TaxID=1930953 RepID=UPI0037520E7C